MQIARRDGDELILDLTQLHTNSTRNDTSSYESFIHNPAVVTLGWATTLPSSQSARDCLLRNNRSAGVAKSNGFLSVLEFFGQVSLDTSVSEFWCFKPPGPTARCTRRRCECEEKFKLHHKIIKLFTDITGNNPPHGKSWNTIFHGQYTIALQTKC